MFLYVFLKNFLGLMTLHYSTTLEKSLCPTVLYASVKPSQTKNNIQKCDYLLALSGKLARKASKEVKKDNLCEILIYRGQELKRVWHKQS